MVDRRPLIQAFAKDNPHVEQLQFIRDDPEGFIYKDIGDGLVNYVYRVLSADNKQSVVLKYGETTMKNLGGGELSLSRQNREYEALKVIHSVLPDNVVTPYCLDNKHHIIAMEDLSGMSLLSESILKGDFDISLARKLGRIMAELHQSTAQQRVSPDVWQKWEKLFAEEEYLETVYSFVKKGFIEDDPMIDLAENIKPTFRQCVAEATRLKLVEGFEKLYEQKDCFVNADCHLNGIFVKGDNIKMFDLEFPLLISGSQQLGTLAITYLMWAYEAAIQPGADWTTVHSGAHVGFRHMIEAYLETHVDLQEEAARQAFMSDLAIMCGSKLFMYVNFAGMENVLKLTDQDKIHMMKMAIDLLKNSKSLTTVEALVAATSAYTK